ncbi:hypothetical protein HYQ46_000594 [Verticillium longisporum]|nr:hypothetical protein HYQ46_000594 [Verticillium longisporum]
MRFLLLVTLVSRLLLVSAAALPIPITPRSPDFLDDLSGITDDVVTISISVVRALKTAIRDDALVRNALEPFLDGNDTASATTVCPDVAVLFARGAKEPGKSMSRSKSVTRRPPPDCKMTAD